MATALIGMRFVPCLHPPDLFFQLFGALEARNHTLRVPNLCRIDGEILTRRELLNCAAAARPFCLKLPVSVFDGRELRAGLAQLWRAEAFVAHRERGRRGEEAEAIGAEFGERAAVIGSA